MMQLNVNGVTHDVDDRHESTPLLWVLRDVLGLHGTKFGCGGGFCAACTVLIDGRNERSCQTLAGRVTDREITTVEGASGAVVNAVRQAWYVESVPQCGYCQPGQTLAAISLLSQTPDPDDAAIDQGMSGNLCRCGTYPRIRAAIKSAAQTLASGADVAPLVVRGERDPAPAVPDDALAPYLRVDTNGTITVFCTQIEMGQGALTTLATLVADELDADLDSVQVLHVAGNTARYGNPVFGGAVQLTGDSNSVRGFWARYRSAAAGARARLVAVAADRWGLSPQDVSVSHGVVRDTQGREFAFGDLAADAASLTVPDTAQPKSSDDYRLIGRAGIPRVDSAAKILGQTRYTIDVAFEGLVTAIVVHPPKFGATVQSVDDTATRSMPGVVDVVTVSTGVAVVGETFNDAQKGAAALNISWDDSAAEQRSTEELMDEHRRLVESGEGSVVAREDGDAAAALDAAATSIDAIYELPYLSGAPMEPHNASCRMREDGVLELWAGTQAPDYAQHAAARAADLPLERVEVHVMFAGGGFGLRGSGGSDPISEAVEVARALDWRHPVKVQARREEEFKSGRFRPMAVHRVRAGVDSDGRAVAYRHDVAVEPLARLLPVVNAVLIQNGVDLLSVGGAVDMPYAIPNVGVRVTDVETGVPVLTWRSIGNSHNEFARESSIDELAAAGGRDPLDFRREMLADSPRTLRALERVAEEVGWSTPPPDGWARGLACSNGFASHSAQVIEVSADARGRVRIERVVCVLDCGVVISPDLVIRQAEGGIVFALSAALWGEIVLGDGGEIVTQNFDRYPPLRMQSTPKIEVYLIDSAEEPGGVGEVSVPSVAPALANAVAALTGTRVRRLPITKTVKFSTTGSNTAMADITITATENGPYSVSGPVTITDYDGRELDLPDQIALCRCGQSKNKPFCDGSHLRVGFDGTLAN